MSDALFDSKSTPVDVAAEINAAQASVAVARVASLASIARKEMASQDPNAKLTVAFIADVFVRVSLPQTHALRFAFLCDCCFYYHRIGDNEAGMRLAKHILSLPGSEPAALRRLHNVLGVLHMELAEYAMAMNNYEIALCLARELADPFLEYASLSNIVVVLKGMGLYHDAIATAERVLQCDIDSPQAKFIRFQAAETHYSVPTGCMTIATPFAFWPPRLAIWIRRRLTTPRARVSSATACST